MVPADSPGTSLISRSKRPLLGLQPRARALVQRQLHLPPAVEEPRIALPPHHVEVPPEVVAARRRRHGEEEERQPAGTGGAHA